MPILNMTLCLIPIFALLSCKGRAHTALRSDGIERGPSFAALWKEGRSERLQCDPAKVLSALKMVKASGDVPAIPVPREDKQPVHRSHDPLNAWTAQVFAKLVKAALGNPNALTIVPCDDERCLDLGGAMAMVDEPAIYVSTNFTSSQQSAKDNALWSNKDVVAFIIAHEISHYLLERSIDLLGGTLSPCGQISLLRAVGSLPFHEMLIKGGLGHSEVDFFAYQLLKLANLPYSGGLMVLQDQIVDPAKDYSGDPSVFSAIPEQIRANGYKQWMSLEGIYAPSGGR